MSLATHTRRARAGLLTAFAAVALTAALAGAATEPATAQTPSGCFLNGNPVPSFQADNAVGGFNGPDVIDCSASPKARLIFGRNGGDTIIGSSFDDTIHGDFGNDTISGRGGNDFVSGENGDDRLNGGSGTDRCVGSAGTDTAVSCESTVGIP
jgi:Ca2+-binding RTX toxin-like protein